MLKKFIERPVLSTVVSLIIVILGILGITALPVSQYPDIAPPTVQVTANYPGASAETVLESVIIPIEEQVNGVEGMDYITSTASNSGRAEIQVFLNKDMMLILLRLTYKTVLLEPIHYCLVKLFKEV